MKAEDLTGKKFGKLTIIRRGLPRPGSTSAIWDARCECGRMKEIRTTNINKGKGLCCINCQTYVKRGAGSAPNFTDLTGKQYGFLTVLGRSDKSTTTSAYWHVLCTRCGLHLEMRTSYLTSVGYEACAKCRQQIRKEEKTLG